MSNSQGWIKIHRQLLENPLIGKPNYLALWIILLLKANHKPKTFIWNGKKQICSEGQLLTGRNELSKQSGICAGTVENILKYLEIEQQIEQQKTNKFRLITIKKWKDYQKNEQHFEQQIDNRLTTDCHQIDTNKNDNNEKNEKNIATVVASEPFNFDNTLERWIKGTNRTYSLIGQYLKERGLIFESQEQMQAAANRHRPAAKRLLPFSDEQIAGALYNIRQRAEIYEIFTLETILKYLTK